ncbi:hypothetical protein ACP70R_019871 [Stipagrostis hirtigluma subsp. patula]
MQAAVSAASWVVGKALSPIVDGFLEAWAASEGLGPNVDALKLQLLYAQAMLENAQGREIRSAALKELLLKLRGLAYNADDVLDELDYFRIQDELLGTHHAATDVAAAGGCVHGLALHAGSTYRHVASKLKLCSGKPSESNGDPEEEDDDHAAKQGCLTGVLSSCGRRAVSSSPPLPTNQGDEVASGGCMPKVTSAARNTAHAVGKRLSCCFSKSAAADGSRSGMLEDSDIPRNGPRFHCCAWPSKVQQRKHAVETPRLMFNRVEISQRMEDIVEQLKPVCAMVSTILNLEFMGSNRATTSDIAMHRPQTTSGLIEPKLYGRDDQLRSIVHDVTIGKYSAQKITVLPIVGPGGIGKTAFAQHVYKEVKSHFHVSIWICVSLNFNANRLAQDILKQLPKVDGEKENASQEELIERRIKSKQFLLILDDIWTYEEDEWKKLLSPFSNGADKGNMVIVTTRFLEVAKRVKRGDCLMELGSLGPEALLDFFGACVFGHEQPWKGHEEFLEVGKDIVQKLKGSPLAAKTVGRLLRNQPTLAQWRKVLGSKEWEHQTSDGDIMPALKLSYNYLPFHLQQCFSYCALFPEDYEFDGNELIHFWIGLDILHSVNRNKGIEDVGHSCLEDLVNYGFLKKNERNNGHAYYVVHDLLHELAVKVSSEECVSICSSSLRSIQIPTSVRHLSITIDEEDVKDRLTFKHYKKEFSAVVKMLDVENLRTLMLFGIYHGSFVRTFGDLFRKTKTLRTILCEASYSVEDLLPNFSELVHLRYFRIKKGIYGRIDLPNALSGLYHLKILDVQECKHNAELPREINNLINLQHVLFSDDSLYSDISEVEKLRYLKELQRFEVKKVAKGFELKQLGQLLELQVLGIYGLENVEVKEAGAANLIQKDQLQELTLAWDIKGSKQGMQEDDILECLKPHANLQKLCIRGHGGAKCPTWLGVNLSVENLEHLRLDDVAWEELPPWGGLQMLKENGETSPSQKFVNLRRLELVNVRNLKSWVGTGPCYLFSQLEALVIKGCKELLELPFSHPTSHQQEQVENMDWFPNLRKLEIVNCPQLSHVPPVPWTCAPCSAEIERVDSDFYKIEYTEDFCLNIRGKDNAADSMFWKVLAFDNLSRLREFSIWSCPPLSLDHLQILPSLRKLEVCISNTPVWLVESESCGKYEFPVECIKIDECSARGKELTRLLSYFPKLSTLSIESCEGITGLGVAEQPTTAITTSLSLSSANEVQGAQTVHQQQEEEDAKGEEEIAASAEGLLLLPPQLQELKIDVCGELRLHPSDKEAGATEGGLQGLHSLMSSDTVRCSPFLPSYSPSSTSCFPFPVSLQKLNLTDVKGMKTLVPLSNLASLTELIIFGCGDLRGEGLWPLLAHGHLTELVVRSTPDLFASSEPPQPHEREVPPCSSNLQALHTDDATGVLAAPICSLLSSSLTKLVFEFDKVVERFTKEQEEALQLLTSLQDLQFWFCRRLQCLPAGLRTLLSLKRLEIWCCDALQSLPNDVLPCSLQVLCLRLCQGIQSLLNDGLPSSLQVLQIEMCPAIRSLPKTDSLPSSLRELDVRACDNDELRRRCRKLIGTIPIVKVD